jgi:hypothetical protein
MLIWCLSGSSFGLGGLCWSRLLVSPAILICSFVVIVQPLILRVWNKAWKGSRLRLVRSVVTILVRSGKFARDMA